MCLCTHLTNILLRHEVIGRWLRMALITTFLWHVSIQAMARYYGEYGSRNQQDAHEFLGDVINTLQEELCPLARTLAASYLQPGNDLKSEAKATSSAGLTLSVGGANTPLPTSQPQGSLTEVRILPAF